jgi:hypothetical protein
MSSEDSSFNENVFSGDETGQIFIAPDTVPELTGASEHTVDTQSGFVVNVKNIDGRISLSVKRRVGTPPTSSVVFTPNESLKLSKILALSSDDELKHSGDIRLSDISSYYATDFKRVPYAGKAGNFLSVLRSILLLVFIAAAAAAGYYLYPVLHAWLK